MINSNKKVNLVSRYENALLSPQAQRIGVISGSAKESLIGITSGTPSSLLNKYN